MKRNYFAVLTGSLLAVVSVMPTIAQQGSKHGDNRPPIGESVQVETPRGPLFGTLLRPATSKRVPLVLIIAGSGPTDRDGNSVLLKGPNNSLKMLAEGLAANGIASVRYDKTGVGESGKALRLAEEQTKTKLGEADLRFETFIEDAVLWGQKLRKDQRFSTITIAGHSEGSLIGMVAAKRIGADGFVSMSGLGRPMQQVLLEQVRAQLPPDLLKEMIRILDQLAAGNTAPNVPPALNSMFRPGIQPYMISWFRYDPAREIAALPARMPVLITQGTTDIQVTVSDARLLAAARSPATLLLIDGMNHIFKSVPADQTKQLASYSDPDLQVVPELISGISHFVARVKPLRN
jgi:pimeloyl-ACP methyl ester carboxylesterase